MCIDSIGFLEDFIKSWKIVEVFGGGWREVSFWGEDVVSEGCGFVFKFYFFMLD